MDPAIYALSELPPMVLRQESHPAWPSRDRWRVEMRAASLTRIQCLPYLGKVGDRQCQSARGRSCLNVLILSGLYLPQGSVSFLSGAEAGRARARARPRERIRIDQRSLLSDTVYVKLADTKLALA